MKTPAPAIRRRPRGITLVEVAISLVLLALATGTVVAVLHQQLVQRKMSDTDAVLVQAHDALLAYVTTYGYLPCPATANTQGREDVAKIVNGVRTCTAESGFLPAVTLGMPNLDAWGLLEGAWHDASGSTNGTHLRAIRYAVASLAGTPYAGALTSPGLGLPSSPGIRAAVQTQFNANNGLFVCASSAGLLPTNNRCGLTANNTVAANTAVILWSLGEDAPYIAQFSTDETQNYTPTVARVVVSHAYVPRGAAGGPFDDRISYIAFAAVADRLVYGGFVQ